MRKWSAVAAVLISIVINSVPAMANDIFGAAEQGNLAEVKTFLQENPELITATDNGGYTPLHKAAYNGHVDIIDYLIGQGADINAQSASGSTPLHGAGFYGHADAVRRLIEHGADIEIQNAGGFTPLLSACAGGRLAEASLLIDHGADLNATSVGGETALIHATNSGNPELVKLLLDKGLDPNVQTATNQTALYRAIWNNNPPIAVLLVDHGADVNAIIPDRGISLLYFTIAFRDSSLANRMIDRGTDFNQRNHLQMTMLHYAAARGFADQVAKIVEAGADVNAACVNGKTPLYFASIWGHNAIADYLVEHGADPNAGQAGQLSGEYLGCTSPGGTPEPFAENALLTPFAPHGSIAFSPDGRELLWCHHALPIQAMWRMTRDDGMWSLPHIAPFTDPATEYWDGSPSFSADGSRIFFHSHRPLVEGGERNENSDLWYVEKQDDGWGEPVAVGSPVNTAKGEFEPAVSASGDLYFIGSEYDNSIGAGDIYVSSYVDGRYTAPRNLGPAVNSEYHELGPAVAPDESYLLFASDRPYLGRRSLGLYVSFKKADGDWTDAVNLGRVINAEQCWHPSITPDGKYIIYLRGENYYWFSAVVIADMRNAILGPGRNMAAPLEAPHFRMSDQVFEHARTNTIALGDLDGDNDLDAVFSNMGFVDSRVYLNDGHGKFEATDQLLTQQGHGVGLGDLDGDGDLDIVMTCAGYGENNIEHHRPSKIYFNDGRANFTDSGQDLGDSLLSGTSVTLNDIDGDGNLDAMITYHRESNRIYVNDGSGRFIVSELTFPDISTWGDVDNDGDIDILAREIGVGFAVLLNDGSGQFTRYWEKRDSTAIRGRICLSDLDGDHDMDAVVTHGDHTGYQPSTVWINDGTGRFTEITSDLPITYWARMARGDLNHDGHDDIFVTNMGYPSSVWLGDGRGHVRDCGLRLPTRSLNAGCSLGDLDGDGDLDVFIAGFGGGPNELWFNEQ